MTNLHDDAGLTAVGDADLLSSAESGADLAASAAGKAVLPASTVLEYMHVHKKRKAPLSTTSNGLQGLQLVIDPYIILPTLQVVMTLTTEIFILLNSMVEPTKSTVHQAITKQDSLVCVLRSHCMEASMSSTKVPVRLVMEFVAKLQGNSAVMLEVLPFLSEVSATLVKRMDQNISELRRSCFCSSCVEVSEEIGSHNGSASSAERSSKTTGSLSAAN